MISVPWQWGQCRTCIIMLSLGWLGGCSGSHTPREHSRPTPLKHPPPEHSGMPSMSPWSPWKNWRTPNSPGGLSAPIWVFPELREVCDGSTQEWGAPLACPDRQEPVRDGDGAQRLLCSPSDVGERGLSRRAGAAAPPGGRHAGGDHGGSAPARGRGHPAARRGRRNGGCGGGGGGPDAGGAAPRR